LPRHLTPKAAINFDFWRPRVPNLLDIKGNYFVSGNSKSFPARLISKNADQKSLLIELEDGSSIRSEITSVSDRLGQTERRLEFADGSAFLTYDNNAIDQLTSAKGGWFSRVFALEAFHPRLLVFIAAAILLIFGMVRYGLPVAAKVAVWATPDAAIVLIDNSSLSTIDRLITSKSDLDKDRQETLRAGFRQLVDASKTTKPAKLLFRDGGRIGPNAFALPAGTIVLTDQLAELLTDDEIIAVFAHELVHVENNHSLQQMYRAFGFAAIVTVVAGDMSLVMEEILGGGGLMIAMAASREMELEADAEGVALLKTVDRDPNDLKTALDKLHKKMCPEKLESLCKDTGWFSSHPGSDERTKALENAISQ